MPKLGSLQLVMAGSGRLMLRLRGALFVGLSVVLLLPSLPSQAGARAVHALFNLETLTGGPFPSDRFTSADPSQNTGLRINLPKPDCRTRPSDCEDLDVLNTLDGFNLQPQLSIPFDGPIDVNSVTSQTVFLISLGNTLDSRNRGGRRIGINQVVWDTKTNTLHVWSDEQLDQHTRYGLIVTRGVRDASGDPVEASEAFRRFLATGVGDYRTALLAVMKAVAKTGTSQSRVASASVFTTQSVTAALEKIRDQIKAATLAPADFRLGAGGNRTVFKFDQVTGITWSQQTAENPPKFNKLEMNLQLLRLIPGAIGQIAFGKYVSPDYLVHPGEYIPPAGTRTGRHPVQRMNEIYFNLFLPSSPKPPAGWPVAIYGHGSGQSKQGDRGTLNSATTMAAHGIATIAINVVGHGFGRLGTVTVNQEGGVSVTFPAGGRGIDQNHDGQIGGQEGIQSLPPRSLQGRSDGLRQTVADLIQLVWVIEAGMDMDGDGKTDLDPSRIYYFGISAGGTYGLDFVAIEPDVRAAVLNVPSAPGAGFIGAGRAATGNLLAVRRPSLINSPGITSLDGLTVNGPHFNENMPLRSSTPVTVRLEDGTNRDIRSPVINTTAGAMEIQEYSDHVVWANQASSAAAYAPHLRKNPLPGMTARPVLLQFARGDYGGNPTHQMTILRAGDLADRATFFRNDLAYAENPAVPKNPHPFMVNIDSAIPLVVSIARGAQEQIAVFFASNGTRVIRPEPHRFFEVPIARPLPEALNYIP